MLELRKKYDTNYARARGNLLLMAALTLVNLVMIVANATLSFPFSAVTPQLFLVLGGEFAALLANEAIFYIAAALGVVLTGVYFLCWYLSGKRGGWMIAALVLFSLDSLVMLGMMALSWDVSWLVDVAFHAWVMYYLVIGVAANSRLKGMPSMEELQAAEAAGQAQPEPAPELPAQ